MNILEIVGLLTVIGWAIYFISTYIENERKALRENREKNQVWDEKLALDKKYNEELRRERELDAQRLKDHPAMTMKEWEEMQRPFREKLAKFKEEIFRLEVEAANAKPEDRQAIRARLSELRNTGIR